MMKRNIAIMALALACAVQAELTPVSPADGAEVRQINGFARKYILSPQKARSRHFDYDKDFLATLPEKGTFRCSDGVRFAWTATSGEGDFTLEIEKACDGTKVFSASVSSNEFTVSDLEIAREYRWRVSRGGETAGGSFRTEDLAPRFLYADGVRNLRDLGGRKGLGGRRVRQGRIFRCGRFNDDATFTLYPPEKAEELWKSGELAKIDRPDARKFCAIKAAGGDPRFRVLDKPPTKMGRITVTEAGIAYLTGVLGIRTDLDLRDPNETYGMMQSPLGPGVKFINLNPVMSYGSFVRKDEARKIRDESKIIRDEFKPFLDESNYPIVFHCSAGADRTGILAYALNGILGVQENELRVDWEVTWLPGAFKWENFKKWDEIIKMRKAWSEDMVKSFRDYPGATFTEKVENAFLAQGITKEEIERFRALMLEPSGAVAGAVFDVRDFGAKGDGVAKDTAAIQKAIDAASAAGGGTVRLGAGTYLSGSVYLKSNIDFFLDHGSTLKGSPDKADYNAVDVCPQNSACKAESASGAHLVLCIEQTNVTIRGTGRIEGNSPAFLAGPDGRNWPGGPSNIPWRPSQMVYFVECADIELSGISLIDAPYWSCFLHGCRRARVRDLLIRTRREPVHTHNGDGLDIDCCEDVEVTGCDIDTAGDCIALRGNAARLTQARPCRNIRISNCRLSSACNTIHLGGDAGNVLGVVIRDITVSDTRTAVNVDPGLEREREGVSFEDIVFDGMDVECRSFCRIYPNQCRNAYFKGIRFRNVRGTTQGPSWVTGRPVDDVTFENVDLPHGVVSHGVPGDLPIGGTIRGGMAFGGKVKMPMRGLCAHQGDRQFFPGNTAEALASAARKGVAMVEFDVQRCKTGEFVLMHDPTLERLTTGQGRVREHTLSELKSYTLRQSPEKAYRIPTFDEALDVLPDGGILINVHCYAGSGAMGDIARHLKARGRLHQAFVCANLDAIDLARRALPEIAANDIQRPGPRNREWTPEENARFVSEAAAHRCQYLQLSRPWPRKYSDDAHAAGIKVIHYHSDDPSALDDLMVARGIDFVMTNRPEPMNAAFRALGLDMFADPIQSTKNNTGKEAMRLRELSPVLATRTPPQPAPAKILSGPEKDARGNVSISMLMKRYRGETYLIATNGTSAEVRAEFDLGVRPAKAEVLWENRTVPVTGGKITDCFAPLAVHVYKVEDPIAYIAHQGEEALAPHHSKPAYRLAAEHGLDYLKLDLQETKDGHVVLQHDRTLTKRMNWDVKIANLTLAEIRARGRYIPRGGYTNETIVTLQEALEIAKGMKKGIWFDFKHFTPAFAEKVFRIADEAGFTSNKIIVATFSKPALKWVQQNRPEVRRVAHTFIRKVKGGFQINAGDDHKVYPSVDAVVEGLERHARDYGLYGLNVPRVFRSGRQLYTTPASLVKRLHDDGYWISIWFAHDAGTAEYYREAGADAFVTEWKDSTFPEYFPEKERRASLMRLMARTEMEIKDAGSKRRNEALYFCTWEPELAADAVLKSGKWPNDSNELIDVLENASWTMPEDREPR